MIYFYIAFLLIYLSFHFDICGKQEGRRFWYITTAVILILVAGLRYRLGTDTSMYLDNFYYYTPTLSKLTFDDIGTRYPLWNLMMSLILTLGMKFYVVQLVQSAFVNILLFRYLQRHTKYVFTCLFFYYIWIYTSYNMEELKATISVVICLYANDYILEKKWNKGYLLYTVAVLFHFSALLILFTPLLFSLKLNKNGFVILLGVVLVGYFLQNTLGNYIEVFSYSEELLEKFEDYSTNEKHSSGLNFRRLLVEVIPILIYVIVSNLYLKRKNDEYINKFEPLIMIGLIFIMLQFSIQIFYRYVHFYLIYFIIAISQMFVRMSKGNVFKGELTLQHIATISIFLPLFFCLLHPYRGKYFRYYPYSSVIERKADKKRENKLHEYRPWRDMPRKNNY